MGIFNKKPDVDNMPYEELILKVKKSCLAMPDVLGGMVAGRADKAISKYYSDEMKKHRGFLRMAAAVFGEEDPKTDDILLIYNHDMKIDREKGVADAWTLAMAQEEERARG